MFRSNDRTVIAFGPSTQSIHIQRDIGVCAVAVRWAEREPIIVGMRFVPSSGVQRALPGTLQLA